MAETESQPRILKFANFEVDLRAGELRKDGARLKFGGQPFQVLAFLLERADEVVTREELQKHLWPDTFVDVDHNLNTAINKIREALGDSAESPRFVETLPRRGYRFIAPVNGRIRSSEQPAEATPPPAPIARWKPMYYGLALIAAVLITVTGFVHWRTTFRPVAAPKVLGFRKLTGDGHGKLGPMATDGSRIYFTERLAGAGTLMFQVPVKGGEATPLAVPLLQPSLLNLSGDGTELLVASGAPEQGSSFWIQPVSGGSPRRVGNAVGHDAAFGMDGTSVLYGTGHDIYSASRDGSLNQKLLTIESLAFGFRFSPDRRVFRFAEYDNVTDTMKIMEASPQGSGPHKLLDGCCGEWTPDGRFFIFQNRVEGRLDLWASAEANNFRWRKRNDKPIELTSGPLDFQYPLPSKDGKEIFALGSSRRAEVVRFDPRSGEFIPFLAGISAEGVAFSPGGQWVVYTSYPDGTLWRSKADGSERLQLTFPPMRTFLPRWSPDGKQIAFSGNQPGEEWNIYLISNEGGTPQRILLSQESQSDANWSPDGKSLVFASSAVATPSVYTIDLKTRQVSTLPGSSGLYSPHWSPDGRFVAAMKGDVGGMMLFEFASQKWTEAVADNIGFPNWSHDGKYIYFESFPLQGNCPILRFRMSDRKVEEVADPQKIWRVSGVSEGCGWLGLAADDSPMVTRDISTQEIYALEMEWP